MVYSDLFIIGNGFDLAHGMPTSYGYFRKWLIDNNRLDVIFELQKAYPVRLEDDFLLWSDFERSLGQYDFDKVINWGWDDLYLTEVSIGDQMFHSPDFFLNSSLPDIVNGVFSEWMHSVPVSNRKLYEDINDDAFYICFNYTDTLEALYCIPERLFLHIHGRASKGEHLIVGHNRLIDPFVYSSDGYDVRENNERMQRLLDMNSLCKPFAKIIEQNDFFFEKLGDVKEIYVRGHSCDDIDYPYFRKIKESVLKEALWHFYPFSLNLEADKRRIDLMREEIGINSFVYHYENVD